MAKATHSSLAVPTTTVCVVDDDADVRHAVSLLIRSIGLTVNCYAAAQDFLDNYDAQVPGCLVLDVRMPGMSGLELQKRFSSVVDSPPIIFITAHGEIPLATQALRAGAVDFIQKPFSPQELLDRVNEAIELDRDNRCKSVRRGYSRAADAADRVASARSRICSLAANPLSRSLSTCQSARKPSTITARRSTRK